MMQSVRLAVLGLLASLFCAGLIGCSTASAAASVQPVHKPAMAMADHGAHSGHAGHHEHTAPPAHQHHDGPSSCDACAQSLVQRVAAAPTPVVDLGLVEYPPILSVQSTSMLPLAEIPRDVGWRRSPGIARPRLTLTQDRIRLLI
ncbi:hypothetical protein [Henriciella litoralis]|uniref:hypothetical protein n=1 Tax=Henriciella litoralis TaxID=568102 RepID=UPI0009FBAED6|nr:hypothetical protein [Henriciella litoralis]